MPCVFLSLLHCWLSEWLLWFEFEASQSLTFWMFRLCLGSHFASCGTFRGLSLVGGSIWAGSSMTWPASYVSQSATIQTSYCSPVLSLKRELIQRSSPLWRLYSLRNWAQISFSSPVLFLLGIFSQQCMVTNTVCIVFVFSCWLRSGWAVCHGQEGKKKKPERKCESKIDQKTGSGMDSLPWIFLTLTSYSRRPVEIEEIFCLSVV